MFVDARSLPDGRRLDTDLCVVGAGAAGIALARRLADAPFRVTLLESGGLEFDEATQALCRGDNVGFPYYPLDAVRLRYFGGTTNHWAGTCRPLEPIDFESRAWVPRSGWPFDKARLDPYYANAQALCQLGDYDYDPAAWEAISGPRLPLDDQRVVTAMFQLSPPTRFGSVYRADVEHAPSVTTFLFANATEVVTDVYGSRVTELRCATLAGNRFSVSARAFVLATGAIENARLLLASRSVRAGGVGNDHDQVGRCFMEHLSLPAGVLVLSDPGAPMGLYETRADDQRRPRDQAPGRGFLALAPAAQRDERLLNARVYLLPVRELEALDATSDGLASIEALGEGFGGGDALGDLGPHVERIVRHLDDVIMRGYRGWFRRSRPFKAFYLYQHMEHAPNPDSRVALAAETDALGQPRAQLDWRFSELERRTLRHSVEILAAELGRIGLGRVRAAATDVETGWPSPYRGLRGAWHQMGTTRMSDDPRLGVVDADARVHGTANLYVAGSSVFPTSGYTNPTLTLVALALRLADHLRERLA